MLFFREENPIPKFGNIKERESDQSWTLDTVPSQQIIHRSIKFVAFALVPVFWHFRWIQKCLQGIHCPRGSFKNFSITTNYMLKSPIPSSPCLKSDCMHAQGLQHNEIRDFALVYLVSEWQTSGFSAPNGTDIDFASFKDRSSSWTCVHSCLTCIRVHKECSVGKTLVWVPYQPRPSCHFCCCWGCKLK